MKLLTCILGAFIGATMLIAIWAGIFALIYLSFRMMNYMGVFALPFGIFICAFMFLSVHFYEGSV